MTDIEDTLRTRRETDLLDLLLRFQSILEDETAPSEHVKLSSSRMDDLIVDVKDMNRRKIEELEDK